MAKYELVVGNRYTLHIKCRSNKKAKVKFYVSWGWRTYSWQYYEYVRYYFTYTLSEGDNVVKVLDDRFLELVYEGDKNILGKSFELNIEVYTEDESTLLDSARYTDFVYVVKPEEELSVDVYDAEIKTY